MPAGSKKGRKHYIPPQSRGKKGFKSRKKGKQKFFKQHGVSPSLSWINSKMGGKVLRCLAGGERIQAMRIREGKPLGDREACKSKTSLISGIRRSLGRKKGAIKLMAKDRSPLMKKKGKRPIMGGPKLPQIYISSIKEVEKEIGKTDKKKGGPNAEGDKVLHVSEKSQNSE